MITSPQLATTETMSSSETISFTCCCGECESKALGFYRFFKKTKAIFITGIILVFALLFVAILFLSAGHMGVGGIIMGGSVSLLGAVTAVFPFATPQTFAMLGIHKTVMLTRALGIAVTALGPVLAYWMQE
jgi:hypothetical protein